MSAAITGFAIPTTASNPHMAALMCASAESRKQYAGNAGLPL
jgi:hypothetical protein